MDSQDNNSWDDLLQDLGADPSPENDQPAPASASTPQPALDLENLAPPEPADSGWDSLLGDLGIEAETPPITETPTAAEDTQPAANRAAEREQKKQEAAAQAAPRPPAPAPPNPPRQEAEPVAAPRDHEATPEPASPAPLPDLKTSLSLPDWFPFAGRRNKAAAKAAEESARAAANEPPQPEPLPAVGDDQPAAPIAKDRGPAPGDPADVQPPADSSPERGSDPLDADLATPELTDAVSEEGREGGEEGAEEKPTRRRRRRRGGRRRRRSSGGESAESTAPDSSDNDRSDALVEQRDQPPTDPDAQPVGETDQHDDELEADELNETEPGPRGRRERDSAKIIPAWPEAIAVLIDRNIAMRSERKSAAVGASGRGRGGGRGRSRGRRRRKPSE